MVEYASETAEYIYNRTVNAQNESPRFSQMYGTRDSLPYLRSFRCRAYPNAPLQLRLSGHQDVAYEGTLVEFGANQLLLHKIYEPKLKLSLINPIFSI